MFLDWARSCLTKQSSIYDRSKRQCISAASSLLENHKKKKEKEAEADPAAASMILESDDIRSEDAPASFTLGFFFLNCHVAAFRVYGENNKQWQADRQDTNSR